MPMQEINVRGTTSNGVVVATKFLYNMPDSLQSAVESYGEDQVFALITRQLTVDLQAPSRKELVSQWELMPEDSREAVTIRPAEENGTATATLPELEAANVQAFMDEWKPGQKSTRVRTVRHVDAVAQIMSEWDTYSPERQAQILEDMRNRMAALTA